MFNLVLITALGAITTLSTHDTQAQCFEARKMIDVPPNYSTACLQQSSPEQIQQNMQQSMEMMQVMFVMMKTFAQSQ